MEPVLQMYLHVPVLVTSWNAGVSSFSNDKDNAQLSYINVDFDFSRWYLRSRFEGMSWKLGGWKVKFCTFLKILLLKISREPWCLCMLIDNEL